MRNLGRKYIPRERSFLTLRPRKSKFKSSEVASGKIEKKCCLSPMKRMGLQRRFLNKIINTKVLLLLIKYANTI